MSVRFDMEAAGLHVGQLSERVELMQVSPGDTVTVPRLRDRVTGLNGRVA